jgi:Putative Ig domain
MDRALFFTRKPLRRHFFCALASAIICAATAAAHASGDGLAISGSPSESATIGESYSFTPTVSDPSKRELSFGITNKPGWASFSTSTGKLSGTPTADNIGTIADIVIRVTDSVDLVSLPEFSITVHAADKPAISGSPAKSATVGQAYVFTPIVTNPEKLALTFSITNKPAWATFSTSTGKLSGTPTAVYAGTTEADIRISVTDGVDISSLEFSVKVNAASAASGTVDKPVISGTPATSVTAGSTYAFQPSAKDPDGKALSFSVQNKPVWASFSIASGLLDGTPSSTQTGTYADIIISASNGQYSSALPAFSIAVNAAPPTAATGTAKLSWVLPTENTNGTPLNDLAGVRIYYGTSASALSKSVQVSGTTTTSYTVSGLSAGAWYFGAEAYTTTGMSSSLSAIVSTTVP